MTDAEMLAEGALYGTWLEPVNGQQGHETSGRSASWPERVAFVGGSKFDEGKLAAYLNALRAKYSGATVVTGAAKGAEAFIQEKAAELGFTVEVPPLIEPEDEPPAIATRKQALERLEQVSLNRVRLLGLGKAERLAWQVNDILIGADAIVVVGSPTAARASLATAIHKRVDGWRENGRPFVNVAVPAKVEKEGPPKRANRKSAVRS